MSDLVSLPQHGPVQAAGPSAAPLAAPPAKKRPGPAQAKAGGRRTGYLLSWGVLALVSTAYMAAVIVRPDLLAQWAPTLGRIVSQPQGNDQHRSSASAETQKLRTELGNAQTELARLRKELATRDASIKATGLRVAGLEKELQTLRAGTTETASFTPPPAAPAAQPAPAAPVVATAPVVKSPPAAPPAPPAAPTAAAVASTAPAAEPGKPGLSEAIGAPKESVAAAVPGSPRTFEIVNGAPSLVDAAKAPAGLSEAQPGTDVALPLPTRRPAAAVPAKSSPIAQIVRPTIAVTPGKPDAPTIETGSVSAPATVAKTKPADKPAEPITFGAPVVTRSPSQVGIRLTAGPSVDALRLSWSLMSERYGAELGSLQPRYVTGSTPAGPYALVAGPLASDADAQRVCGALIAKGIPCSVDSFVGNAL